ncbi:MAG: hypothetical protein MUP24_12260 [Gillisia sp.]|nr:hypothetical protein [Gillisia sp.]
METNVIFNSSLHFEHNMWKAELLFWEDELKSFNNRLGELVMRWTDKDLLVQLEQFQNKFILHGEVIEKFQNEINHHETDIAAHSKKGEEVLDQVLVKKHIETRNRIEIERNLYNNLKKDFFRFLSKYM